MTISKLITINISRILETSLDELEYRLAKRAVRNAAKLKVKRLYRAKALPDKVGARQLVVYGHTSPIVR